MLKWGHPTLINCSRPLSYGLQFKSDYVDALVAIAPTAGNPVGAVKGTQAGSVFVTSQLVFSGTYGATAAAEFAKVGSNAFWRG